MPNVTVHPTGEVIYVEPGETVLGGLYKAGYAYTIGCRRGGCAICKVDVLEGTVSYNRTVADDVLTADERAEGVCLTCRAVPESDLTIEMRDETLRLVNTFLRQINDRARERAASLASGTTTGTTSKE